ncbi:MAG: fused MFS/spermidine synthase [Acidobacteria bacterium]|nr:fused MFS/spermidine synthase [Acidobacteriota bacterium]
MNDPRPRPKFVLEITVFMCGALVMIFEIIGSRLLAPYIGTSTYVWTSLIGVILGALSLGYWLGGKTADRQPKLKILASVIFLAGGALATTILFKDVVLALIAESPLILELKSLLAALLLFAPASVLLGFVTPYAVRLKMRALEDSGKTVGRLYALSTVGSILGTFLAGFLLIPFVGSTKTLYLIGFCLIGLSVLLAPFALTKTNLSILIIFVLGILTTELQNYYLLKTSDLHDIDTEYNRVRVFTMTDETSGRRLRAMAIDPYFVQSKMFLDSDELASEYAKYYHLVRHFKPDFERVLLIGGAGYSFPKDYLKTYPGKRIDVVEIDPQMTAIARQYFRLTDSPDLTVFHEDGRVFLNRAPAGQYDAVLMDAFGSLFSVPFQLTTIEAVREIDRTLKPGGVVIFNVGGAITGKASGFVNAEIAAYRTVFPEVRLFKVRPERADGEVQNLIIVACKYQSCFQTPNFDGGIAKLLDNRYRLPFEPTLPALTDDRAPVEYYNSFAQSFR